MGGRAGAGKRRTVRTFAGWAQQQGLPRRGGSVNKPKGRPNFGFPNRLTAARTRALVRSNRRRFAAARSLGLRKGERLPTRFHKKYREGR